MSAGNDQPIFSRNLEYWLMMKENRDIVAAACAHIERENLWSKTDEFGNSLLHIAARYGNKDVMKYLIESGLDVNVQNKAGETPLMMAVMNKLPESVPMIKMLLKENAHMHLRNRYGNSIWTFVFSNFSSNNTAVEKFFLDLIYDECKQNSHVMAEKLLCLRCPLWRAVLLGDLKVIEHMIARGCFIDSCHPSERITSLHRAVSMMDLKTVEYLIKNGANVDFKDHKKMLPIAYYGSYTPGEFQNPEIIKTLLIKSSFLKNYPHESVIIQFRRAFECGTRKVIQMLLERYSDILKIRDDIGLTPLHYLVVNYHADITEELQGLKFNVNARDVYGRTPLFFATLYRYSHINTIRFLLENGANVNAVTNDKEVALFALCNNHSKSEEEYCDIVEMFIQYGLDICFVGLNQKTVFDNIMPVNNFYLAEPLLAHLAILNDQENSVAEHIISKIYSQEKFKNYFELCKRDLGEMKNHLTNQRLTLHMILVNREEKLLNICRYNASSLAELENLKNECCSNNVYHRFIKKRICSIMKKIVLYQNAALMMCKLLKLTNNVNHLVVTEIMSYLNNRDLQILTEIDN